MVKALVLFLLCLVLICVVVDANIIRFLESLNTINQNLAESLLKRSSFRLAREQPLLSGESDKLLLEDNFGRAWLFKFGYGADERRKENFSARILDLAGVDSISAFPFTISINGTPVPGIIIRFIREADDLDLNKEVLSPEDKDYIIRASIVDYWLGSESPFFLRRKQGKGLISGDRDSPFFFYSSEEAPGFFEHSVYKQLYGLLDKEDIDFTKTEDFIFYIGSFRDDYLKKLFNENMSLYYGEEESQVLLEEFLRKKNNLGEGFKKSFINSHTTKSTESTFIAGKPNRSNIRLYALRAIKRALLEIARNALLTTRSYFSYAPPQKDIVIVFSPKAAFLTASIIEQAEDRIDGGEQVNIGKVKYRILSALEALRQREENRHEKLGVILYIEVISRRFDEVGAIPEYTDMRIHPVAAERLETRPLFFYYGEKNKRLTLDDWDKGAF
ncbi:MAG: hypothetical protein HQ558_05700 [Candidatus Omnitrophica bacterium]|nr:hypothetical protein [Candidatus Omnitrophota bacterium]